MPPRWLPDAPERLMITLVRPDRTRAASPKGSVFKGSFLSVTQQENPEQILWISPEPVRRPASRTGHGRHGLPGPLVAVFRMDGLAFGKPDAVSGEVHDLIAAGNQVHLDPADHVIPHRLMAEVVQLEISAGLAVQPAQQVQVELRGHAGGIVIGR